MSPELPRTPNSGQSCTTDFTTVVLQTWIRGMSAKANFLLHRNPRLRGIHEHWQRAMFLLDLARHQDDPKSSFRLMLSAVYSCRAITEIMLETAEKGQVAGLDDSDPKKNRTSLEAQISGSLPYYLLLERIRIHDFHRFGISPPDPTQHEMMLAGPVKLVADKGAAAMSAGKEGIKKSETGNSKVKLQRPLLRQNGMFFDKESTSQVTLDMVLDAFLAEVPKVIPTFEGRIF